MKMTKKTLISIMLLLVGIQMNGQFYDDFNQIVPFNQTAWKGDIQDFVLNDSGQLQLKAPEAGSSLIYRKTNLPDSVEWNFFFSMDFSPSNNNRLRVYLQLDTLDLAMASGYFIEIGENGSEDKIKFARMVNGTALTIAEGTPGVFSSEPSEAYIRVTRNAQGLWKVYYRKQEEAIFELDFELFDSTVKRYFDQSFAIECTYTSTRTSHFFFDDISVSEPVPDQMPPKLLEGKLLSNTSLELVFDEILDKTSVLQHEHYQVEPNFQQPVEISFNPFRPNRMTLHFAHPFINSKLYTLAVHGLSDLGGNKLPEPISFEFYFTEKPEYQDIIINEILFDPYTDGEDFIEIYNPSGKIIPLKGLIIKNNMSTSLPQKISQDYDLFPGKYIAVSSDTHAIRQFYPLPDSANLVLNALPSFNNDKGNVSIYLQDGAILSLLDSVDYHEDMHFSLIDNKEGVSLERIFTTEPGHNTANWQSASSVFGNATPGYRNSQFRIQATTQDTLFWLEEAVFSPDQDGFFDNLVVQYQLPEDGWVGTLEVFSISGQQIRTLVNNKLLGTEGIIVWDGLTEDGGLLPVSPYIVLAHLFHPSGKTARQKLVCLLAGKL